MELRVKSEDAAAATNDSPSVTASPLPTSSDYNDFLLRSSAPQSSSSDPNGGGGGWKYNVMKFTAVGDRVIDPADESLFLRPVKLNRKDPRTVRRLTDEDRERHNKRALDRAAKAAGLDPNAMDVDTKPNVDGDGDNNGGEGTGAAEEKEELDPDLVGKGVDGTTTVQRRGPRGQFKKKFQRVYVASEEARRLKREEWQPWVLEDDEGRERWVGRLEGGAGEIGGSANKKGGENAGGAASDQGRIAPSTSTGNGSPASLDGWRPAAEASAAGGGGSAYVAFVFGDNGDEFKVVPINRWYRFNQGPKYLTLAEEEAEAEYARQQKSKEHERWQMRRRAAPISAPTSGSATPRAGPAGQASGGGPATASALRSRMLERSTVGTKPDPDDGGGDLDDFDRPRIRTVISSTSGGGGGAAGGSGGVGGRGGPKRRGGQDQDDDEFDYEEDFQDDEEGIAKIDDLADEEETRELEERIRREMRAAERPDAIPDEPADEDADRLTGTGKEIKKLVRKSDKTGVYESDDEDDNPYASSDAESDGAASTASGDRDRSGSRPSTPRPGSPPSNYRSGSVSRGPSRATSPSSSGAAYLAKRATSPAPSSSSHSNGKRKRDRASTTDGAASDSDADGSKRRKAGGKSPSPAPGGGVLTQADIVAYLRTRPNQTSTTKEVLTHFRKAIKGDARNKASIGGLLRAAANLVDGNLVLKPGL
ncbi:hypothetical protein C6P46_006837 [Rhodotorula mucilaginosa]|uniref:Transcription initiation factor IIF subunit alpha n=1 Tax=Rhodotorula mucilaginosa TaxID=5537 RepID=A0A9P7B8Z4_RHOMI|nr:hypothetical protein C6P46_006837 [Rhodotorula mucilaginosa]TKA53182.1 hypothetical protein B0A53_04038 [Rhodotorula sp. CCFEE 5036]